MVLDDDIFVRDATTDDVSAITQLHNSVIEEGLLTCSIWKTELEILQWLQHLERLQYPRLIIVHQHTLIGFGSFEPVWDIGSDNGCKYSVTLNIVIEAHHRKEGLATTLFEHLCCHPSTIERKLYRVACDILSINKAAKSWLDSIGFYFCGSLKNVAEKEGVLCDLDHYSKFISPAPRVAGLDFPSSDEASPYPPKAFALPIHLDSILVRDARMEDLSEIVGIWNSAILHSDALALTVPVQVSERKQWLFGLLATSLPCLVAVIDGVIVGYTSLNYFSSDPCFSRTFELSVYVRRELVRQRIGQLLGESVLKHPSVRARATRVIVAQIHHNNGSASGALLKAGFDCSVSIAHDFFKDGELQSYSWYSLALPD